MTTMEPHVGFAPTCPLREQVYKTSAIGFYANAAKEKRGDSRPVLYQAIRSMSTVSP